MNKTCKCTCCGKPIKYGKDVIVDNIYTGLFCSLKCWTDTYGISYTDKLPLTDDVISEYNE